MSVSTIQTAVILLLIAAAIAVAFAIWRNVSRRRQVMKIRAFATSVAAGNLEETLDVSGLYGDTRQVAEAVDEMRRGFAEQRESLSQQRALLLDIVSGLREGVVAVSSRRRVTFINDRAVEMFSLSADAVGTLLVETLRHKAVLDAFDEALQGHRAKVTFSIKRGPEERMVECRTFPLGRSEQMAAVALFTDVTRVEKLEAIRRSFLSDFLHEVRTPLAGIRSAVEILEAGGVAEEQEQHLRRIASRQLGRMERLVQDLAELNSIESGDVILNREPTDLRVLADDVADDFAQQLSADGRTLEIRGDRVVANVDPMRVEQILTNLLENSIRHSESPRIELEIAADDRNAYLRVRDFGVGIAPAEHENIFRRFYRVDKSRSQRVPGTGLGLAIVKHLALRHGGSVRVESAEGAGATFEVRLPR